MQEGKMGEETTDTSDFADLVEDNPGATKILAEGDSWFAYPRRFLIFGKDANIIDHLADKPNLIILNSASNSDEVAEMMSGDQKRTYLKRISKMNFDLVLFSGGGNDIVGRYDFGFLLNEKENGMDWKDCINAKRLKLKLRQIELVYRELIERTMEIKPNLRIVTHTYDWALPSKEGFELFDIIPIGKSWMRPYLINKKITVYEDQRRIIKSILTKFKKCLQEVERDYPGNFKVIDTQGLLTKDQWRNEIHPTPEGFGLITDKIYNEGILA